MRLPSVLCFYQLINVHVNADTEFGNKKEKILQTRITRLGSHVCSLIYVISRHTGYNLDTQICFSVGNDLHIFLKALQYKRISLGS